MKKQSEKNISILLANTEWMPPDKLIREVQSERMISGLCDLIKPELADKVVGDAECLAYMMPQTGRVPLSFRWATIYLYLVGRVIKRWKISEALPKDCQVDELSNYEKSELKKLKQWIYKNRGGKYKHPVLEMIKNLKDEI